MKGDDRIKEVLTPLFLGFARKQAISSEIDQTICDIPRLIASAEERTKAVKALTAKNTKLKKEITEAFEVFAGKAIELGLSPEKVFGQLSKDKYVNYTLETESPSVKDDVRKLIKLPPAEPITTKRIRRFSDALSDASSTSVSPPSSTPPPGAGAGSRGRRY
jgi:hypothetical protein